MMPDPVPEETMKERARLEPFVFMRLGYVGVGGPEQVKAIIDRALADPPPVEHPHSWQEIGLCTECDAAAVLRMAHEAAGEPMPPLGPSDAEVEAAAKALEVRSDFQIERPIDWEGMARAALSAAARVRNEPTAERKPYEFHDGRSTTKAPGKERR